MRQPFPFLAQRMFNTPLMLHPAKAEVIMAALAERMGVTQLLSNGRSVAMFGGDDLDEDEWAEERPYQVVQGVAVVPVHGTLVQKNGTLRPYSGMTGYDGIRANLMMALEDDDVRAIVLDLDSPGGECAGVFDLTDLIYTLRQEKPVWGILGEQACSAAYALASACDKISVPRTGVSGSIGVIAMIADISQALSESGITVNVIQFGARKADGFPEVPFTKQARARFQADVDTIGNLFVNTVARNRGLKASAVIAQQAMTYMGQDGVRAGLADFVAAPDAAFREMLKTLDS
jgi:signal peptide peptidase SppA